MPHILEDKYYRKLISLGGNSLFIIRDVENSCSLLSDKPISY